MDTTQKMASQKRNALERIEGLEQMVPNLIRALGKQLDEIGFKVTMMEEMVDSLIGVVGVEPVQKAMTLARQNAAKAKAESQKAETEKLVADGVLEAQALIDEKSVLVLTEKLADGTDAIPGWFRLSVPELKPDFKERLLNKFVGHTDVLENGNTFTVTEVYKINASKAVAQAQAES